MINLHLQKYAFLALSAAALFGASTPLAKLLLHDISPVTLAGLLYLGSGAGLFVIRSIRSRIRPDRAKKEFELETGDYPWLAGAVLAGGIIAPVMLMWGLRGTTASAASLLLNFESIITTLVAAAIFREAVGGRIWLASLVMLAGGLLLSYDPGARFNLSLNSIAVIGACLMWAIDNNLTRRISAGDPVTIAMIKGLATWLVLTEQHEHEHEHEFMKHGHEHTHDEHHQHEHDGTEGPEPHTHAHVHLPLRHAHPHLPDIHHRHEH